MRHLLFKRRFIGLIALALVAGMWPMAAQAATNPSLGSIAAATKAPTNPSLGSIAAAAKAATNPSLGSIAGATKAAANPSLGSSAEAAKAAAPSPGSAAGFAVLAGSAVTCTSTTITGLVGVNFTTTAGCATAQYAPDAYNNFQTTYAGIGANLGPCTRTFSIADTLPASLGPGIYCFTSYLAQTGTTLQLTGAGPWWFEIGISGTGYLEATNFKVLGGNPCNAFWWVRQYATMTDSTFQGTILGGAAITLTRTTLTGRAWATTAVTMTNSTIAGGCSGNATVPGNRCEQGDGNDEDEDAVQSGETGDNDVDEDVGQSSETADKDDDQGVGNSHEGCDRGESDKGDKSHSDDESGSSTGDSSRKDGGETSSVVAKENKTLHTSTVTAKESSTNHTSTGAAKVSSAKPTSTVVMKQSTGSHKSAPAAKESGNNHSDGNRESKNK